MLQTEPSFERSMIRTAEGYRFCASHHGETVRECYVQMFGIVQISFLQ